MSTQDATNTKPDDWDGHPIRQTIARLIDDGGPGEEAAVLSPQALVAIKSDIDAHVGSTELVDVVETVLLVAKFIETEFDSVQCALSLADLCERDVVIHALKELNRGRDGARAEAVAKTANRFTGFTGAETQRRAPLENQPVPKGAMKAGHLDFPKKL